LAVTWSCGIIISLCELFGSESLSQVYAHIIKLCATIDYVPPFFFYDDACHLSRCVCAGLLHTAILLLVAACTVLPSVLPPAILSVM
jgi:hypothetical protein